jgi:GT2 family glycosyltransferase
MKPTHPRIVTVILNTNRRDDTLACLASLRLNGYPNHHIIVLDNASHDGSAEAIRASYPEVEVIGLTRNLGYAGNNNVGIQAAMAQNADWVFILNEDTLLAADCLEQLVVQGESDTKIGIVGPLVYHFDEPQVIQSAGGRMSSHWQSWHMGQNELDRGRFAHPQRVEWISGCAIMVRRAVIEQVGMLDERFYYYWEETEWCFRARQQGWLAVNVPRAKLWHKGVRRHYAPSPQVTYYNTRNRLLFMSIYQAPFSAWAAVWSQFGRTLTSWTLKPKWRAMRPHRDALWQGASDFVRHRWGQRSEVRSQ